MSRRRNVIKPTVKGLIEGMQFGNGIFREYANYWLVKYTDKDDIIWSHQGKENPELYMYVFLNRDRIIKDLYNEVKDAS